MGEWMYAPAGTAVDEPGWQPIPAGMTFTLDRAGWHPPVAVKRDGVLISTGQPPPEVPAEMWAALWDDP
jgi:hypothetical protein